MAVLVVNNTNIVIETAGDQTRNDRRKVKPWLRRRCRTAAGGIPAAKANRRSARPHPARRLLGRVGGGLPLSGGQAIHRFQMQLHFVPVGISRSIASAALAGVGDLFRLPGGILRGPGPGRGNRQIAKRSPAHRQRVSGRAATIAGAAVRAPPERQGLSPVRAGERLHQFSISEDVDGWKTDGAAAGSDADAVRSRREHRQIAGWLGITRRAVLYRLQNARNRRGETKPSHRRSNVPRCKVRLYAASQMTAESAGEILGMEEL